MKLSFYVTFSSENIHFETLPLFKIELEKSKKYKFQLLFEIAVTSYKVNRESKENQKQSGGSKVLLNDITEKVSVVERRTLFLKDLQNLNTYRRIIFADPDYFCYTDVYLAAVKTRTVPRPNNFDLGNFQNLSVEERASLHVKNTLEMTMLCHSIGSQFARKKIKQMFSETVEDFHQQAIKESVTRYKRVALIYQHFRAMMITFNNSTLADDIDVPYLANLGHFSLEQSEEFQNDQESSNNGSALYEKLVDYYEADSESELYLSIFQEGQQISKNVQWMLWQIGRLLVKLNYNVFEKLAAPVVKQTMESKSSQFVSFGDISREKKQRHEQFLHKRQLHCLNSQIVDDYDQTHPFIMLENFEEPSPSKSGTRIPSLEVSGILTSSLVVFVHGYQGSDFDLEMARYCLEMYNLNVCVLMVTSIQDNMDESIEVLGLQLANEVSEHIRNSQSHFNKISFVGYSLGGIVIREAMKHLENYKDRMNLYVSLASPHVGTVDGSNILIKTGLWYLINFENAQNLKELHCQFNTPEEFILKKLSECDALSWFKKCVLISSEEDSFVPYNSSRLDELSSSAITKVMCENIKKRITRLERVEVWFDVASSTGTLDKMLGRRAHIQFLENRVFLECLFRIYGPQF